MQESTLDARVRWWWDTYASSTFSHREYNHLGGEKQLIKGYHRLWLNTFCGDGRCNSARIVEYGIGGGLLGELLLNTSATHYDGIDISQKSLDAARVRLSKRFRDNRFRLHNTTVDFASLRPSIFISQAVIQHFPSFNYTLRFLDRVNRCGADYLMLQIRNGTDNREGEIVGKRGGSWAEKKIKYATFITIEELEHMLDRYTLEWSNATHNRNIYYSFRRFVGTPIRRPSDPRPLDFARLWAPWEGIVNHVD